MKRLIPVLFVIATGLAVFIFIKPVVTDNKSATDTPSSTLPPEPGAEVDPGAEAEPVVAATVKYGDRGFEPASITVKTGSKITFANNSSRSIQPASNLHPSHTANPELNMGSIAAGASKTITVTKVGSWGMHNHLDETMTLTIVVR